MTTAESIISDEEIVRVHAFANFGDMSPREVLNTGVWKYSIGYSGGHTMQQILREHGLITRTKGYRASLTEKGKRYARSVLPNPFAMQARAEKAEADLGRLTEEHRGLISIVSQSGDGPRQMLRAEKAEAALNRISEYPIPRPYFGKGVATPDAMREVD